MISPSRTTVAPTQGFGLVVPRTAAAASSARRIGGEGSAMVQAYIAGVGGHHVQTTGGSDEHYRAMIVRDDSPSPERRAALVLGGGGAFGVVQAAYIQVALDMGFAPEIVVGTSVGALNGAWLAIHPDRPEELLKIWLSLNNLKLVKMSPARLARIARNPISFAVNEIVPEVMSRYLPSARFEDARIDLSVVATNLTKGERRVFRSGPLEQAILASTAIPGVFAPVEIDGDLYVDGGVVASVDLASALEMGATEIFAIDLTPPPVTTRPKTAVGVLRQSFAILSSASTRAVEDCLALQMPVRVVRPDLSRQSPWRLDDSAGAIAHNLRMARESLAGTFDADGHVAPSGTCWASGGPAITGVKPAIDFQRYFRPQRERAAG